MKPPVAALRWCACAELREGRREHLIFEKLELIRLNALYAEMMREDVDYCGSRTTELFSWEKSVDEVWFGRCDECNPQPTGEDKRPHHHKQRNQRLEKA